MKKKEYIVVGIGRFGMSVVRTLAELGVELLVIDRNADKLEEITDIVTHTVCADASDPEVLAQLGVDNFDGAVVTMGKELETSVLVTMQLKELGVPFVMVKAMSDLAARILYKVGADKVIFPEREMGVRVANQIVSGDYFEAIELSERYSIAEVSVPSGWKGKTIREVDIRSRFGVSVIGIRSEGELQINPPPDYRMRAKDDLVVLGENQAVTALEALK